MQTMDRDNRARGIDEKRPIAALDDRQLTVLLGAAGKRNFFRYRDHAAVRLAGRCRRRPVEREVPSQKDAAALVYGALNRGNVEVWISLPYYHSRLLSFFCHQSSILVLM